MNTSLGSGQPAVEISGLSHSYRSRTSLDLLNLKLEPGHFVGLMGENGCGKTTLLKIMAGLISEYRGIVRLHGLAPGPETKSFVSFLPDIDFLPNNWSASDAIGYFKDFYADFNVEKSHNIFDIFGLEKNLPIRKMSKGMREKLQISLLMGRDAKIYLLDEPISGIDPVARNLTLQAVLDFYSPESLVIMSTHLVHDLEPIIDYAIYMRHGNIVLANGADELRSQYGLSLDQIFIKEFS